MPRDGPPNGRRVFRLRSPRPPRARGGPGAAHRTQRGGRKLPADRRDHRRRAAVRRGRDPSRLRVPGRERELRPGVSRRRPDLHRSVRRRHRDDGEQDRRAQRGDPGRCAGRAGHRSSHSTSLAPDDVIAGTASKIGYPVVVKAVAGGGGKGMRVVERARGPSSRGPTARSEAGAAFGDTSVYLERRIARPRHIEIQLLGDHHGTVMPFVERECSIQRRHQKVVEESPSIAVDAGAARADGRGSRGGGAVGRLHQRRDDRVPPRRGRLVLLSGDEHPAPGRASGDGDGHRAWTWCSGRFGSRAARRSTSIPERALDAHGHAIECRIYAEDPDQGFMPSPGLIRGLRPAVGPGRSRRRRRDRRIRGAGLLRLDDRQARRLGRGSRRRRLRGCRARCANTRCSASARRFRSSNG